MHPRLLVTLLAMACAACTVPNAQPGMPNGDLVRQTDKVAPDTVAGARPAAHRDQAVDTDPQSPRTQDTHQRVQTPAITQ